MHRTNTEFKNRYIHSIIQAQIFSSLNELSFRSTLTIKKKKKKKTDETFAPLLNVHHLKTKKKPSTSSSFDKHRFRHTSSRKR